MNDSDDQAYRNGARNIFKDNGGHIRPGLNVIVNETGTPEYTFDPRRLEDTTPTE